MEVRQVSEESYSAPVDFLAFDFEFPNTLQYLSFYDTGKFIISIFKSKLFIIFYIKINSHILFVKLK